MRQARKPQSALKRAKNKENELDDIPAYNSVGEARFHMKKQTQSKEQLEKKLLVQEIMGIRTKLDGFLDMLNIDNGNCGRLGLERSVPNSYDTKLQEQQRR